MLDRIAAIENLEKHRFDDIKKEINYGSLVVAGEKQVKEKTEGLGGSFTFCTLGEPLNLDKLLTGEHLPTYQSIGAWLFHTATGEALDPENMDEANWFLGESAAYYAWLIYRPDLEFLKSRDAALTLDIAKEIGGRKPKDRSGPVKSDSSISDGSALCGDDTAADERSREHEKTPP